MFYGEDLHDTEGDARKEGKADDFILGIHRGIIGYPTPKNPMIVLANSPTKAKVLLPYQCFSAMSSSVLLA